MTIHRTLIVMAAGLGVLATAPQAHAQQKGEFGSQGQFIFSADRLVPLVTWSKEQISNNNQNGGGNNSDEQSTVSLLAGTTGNPEFQSFYTPPRVGFDYTIIPNLTIGGDLFLIFGLASSATNSNGNGNVSVNGPNATIFGIAPRVGYILGLTDVFGIWLRGGISFYDANASTPSGVVGCNSTPNDSVGEYVFGVDLDPQLVITPINHFSFTVGPAVDLGFAGNRSTTRYTGCNTSTTTSQGYQQYNLGLTGGLLGWF